VVYVRKVLGPSKIDVVCSGEEIEGSSSLSLLTNACLLIPSSMSVLLVIDGEPNEAVECNGACVGVNG
jgi:hypothetical protein